ncbi:MAG: hypothetical protein IJS31_03795 [Oscillospiraceae bacterium]|nr:hypothetical protein [Oscillospiraceae bacterium]
MAKGEFRMMILLIFAAFGVCSLLLAIAAGLLLPLRDRELSLIYRVGDGAALEQRVRAYRLLLLLGLLDVPLTLDLRDASPQARQLAETFAAIYDFKLSGGEK